MLLVLAGVAAAGCGRDKPEAPELPELGRVMPNLPLPPSAQLVGRAGSSDALQLIFRSAVSADRVVDYYRSTLTRGEWRLISDLEDRDGVTVLYAERDGPPLWVRVSTPDSLAATGESLVELAGGVADSAAPAPAR